MFSALYNFGYSFFDNGIELRTAIKRNDMSVVKDLIHRGYSVNATVWSSGFTPLMQAAYCGNAEIISILIANGADVNAGDKFGYTALHHAVEVGNREVVKYLLSLGANTSAISCSGTPLSVAIKNDDINMFGLLVIEGSASINEHHLPLHEAIEHGAIKIVKAFLGWGEFSGDTVDYGESKKVFRENFRRRCNPHINHTRIYTTPQGEKILSPLGAVEFKILNMYEELIRTKKWPNIEYTAKVMRIYRLMKYGIEMKEQFSNLNTISINEASYELYQYCKKTIAIQQAKEALDIKLKMDEDQGNECLLSLPIIILEDEDKLNDEINFHDSKKVETSSCNQNDQSLLETVRFHTQEFEPPSEGLSENKKRKRNSEDDAFKKDSKKNNEFVVPRVVPERLAVQPAIPQFGVPGLQMFQPGLQQVPISTVSDSILSSSPRPINRTI